MTFGKYTIISATAVLAALLLGGCAGGPVKISESDRLTDKEKEALIKFSREMLLKTKSIKLSTKERVTIMYKKPEFKCSYTGHKQGFAIISWPVMGRRDVKVVPGATMQVEMKRIKVIHEGNLQGFTGRNIRVSISNTSSDSLKELEMKRKKMLREQFMRR